jgi:SAM-dependent methyltransferase
MQSADAMDARKQQGADFWNANPCGGEWPTYRAFFDWYQRTEPYMYRIFDAHDWRGVHVLDVGCGQGTALNYLPPKGARVTGIDMSLNSAFQARAGARELGHAGQITVGIADAEHLPFPDASFDRVISVGVLHHTPDTEAGIREVYRVLKPGGLAIVMLYRSGNPKWWATATLRGISKLVDRMSGRDFVIADRLRAGREVGSSQGTALLELFGVPVLRAYSNRQCRRMFSDFAEVRITNHQPGFERLGDIVGWLRPIGGLLGFIDRHMENPWGFYQVIEARKA